MICPYCGREFASPPALSRSDNETLICPRCGTREALEALAAHSSFSSDHIEGILTAIYGTSVENTKPTIKYNEPGKIEEKPE